MTDEKREEIFDMAGGSLEKLDVSRGEYLTELYVQNNRLTELDLTANKRLMIVDCTGNPLKKIKALVPGGREVEIVEMIELGANKGGYVGLKFGPGYQTYEATPEEGYSFMGWCNELGDMVSMKPVYEDTPGTARLLIAWFRPAR